MATKRGLRRSISARFNNIKLAAERESCSPSERRQIQALLAPAVAELQSDLRFIELATRGPDTEYAAYLLEDLLRELPTRLRRIDIGLGRALRPR